MSKENPFHQTLKRQDDKVKLALMTRLFLGSKVFSNRPVPSILFFGSAAVCAELFVRYGVYEDYQKAVRNGAADSYPGPFTIPESNDVKRAAEDLYRDGKQTFQFFKRASEYVDGSQTLKKFYPEVQEKEKPTERSWWKPW